MAQRWLIVADDLTGAADAGVAFARRGLKTKVLLPGARQVDEATSAVAYDADTRRGSAERAVAPQFHAVRRFAAADTSVFKKIDSTLRGHPAVEIAALREALAEHQRPTFAVFAPAFPAMGRTTRDGHVFVQGKPLEESETWKREHTYPGADLAEILASAGIDSVKVPLAQVRAGRSALHATLRDIAQRRDLTFAPVAICDADTDADLDNIAAAAHSPDARVLLIGTAGLAHAVARAEPTGIRAPLQLQRSGAGALVVVGSLASASRQAASQLAAMPGVVAVRIESATLQESARSQARAAAFAPIAAALSAGQDVMVEVAEDAAPDLERGYVLVRALAAGLTAALSSMSGLIVTGGETAAALLAQQFVDEIELLEEVEPGVALGLARGQSVFPLMTKPGAFGDAGSLVRALERLRMIRRSGTLA